jgi:hypothetical protein
MLHTTEKGDCSLPSLERASEETDQSNSSRPDRDHREQNQHDASASRFLEVVAPPEQMSTGGTAQSAGLFVPYSSARMANAEFVHIPASVLPNAALWGESKGWMIVTTFA